MNSGDLEALRLGPGDALFFDFDGTLAELGPDPDAIFLPDTAAAALDRLARRLGGAVALISGRDLRDLARRTPGSLWRAGGHGLEVAAPGSSLPEAPPPPPEPVLAALEQACRIGGVRLEIKGPVAALHYRAAPEAAGLVLQVAEAAAAAAPGYVVQAGKMVVEVKPAAAHKGRALARLVAGPPFAGRRPIMVGDDTTDEDAMAAAIELGGLAVKIGEGPSCAPLRAPDPAALRAWLDREARG